MKAEPRWLTRRMLDAFHDQEILRRGGAGGIRDEGGIESALARPHQKWAYGQPDLADLAAAYGFGIARNHGYVDGNKRTAFVALNVFLGLNAVRLVAPEAEAVRWMEDVAAGRVEESSLAAWVRDRMAARDV